MASERLNTYKRNKISKQLITRAFEQKRQDMKNRGYIIFERLVVASWMGQYRAIAAMYKEWPPLFNQALSIHIYRRKEDNFNIEGEYTLPVPQDWEALDEDEIKDYHSLVDVTLGDDLRRYVKDYSSLLKEIDAAESYVGAILAACYTYKKLYEIWPELKTVAPLVQVEPEVTGQWLAPNMPKLNAVLNLPSEPPML